MDEYIKKADLLQYLQAEKCVYNGYLTKNPNSTARIALSAVRKIEHFAKEQPTLEIVKCGECEYAKAPNFDDFVPDGWVYCENIGCHVSANDFCNDGTQKEEENEPEKETL